MLLHMQIEWLLTTLLLLQSLTYKLTSKLVLLMHGLLSILIKQLPPPKRKHQLTMLKKPPKILKTLMTTTLNNKTSLLREPFCKMTKRQILSVKNQQHLSSH